MRMTKAAEVIAELMTGAPYEPEFCKDPDQNPEEDEEEDDE